MPLSKPVAREPIHTRTVTCRGYRRADGLWDIEGHLTDVKAYAFRNDDRGTIESGDPVHEMWIRVTLDERFTIQDIEAITDKSPYQLCPAITPAYATLKGLTIGPGLTRKLKERLGGVHGCTHLTELMGPVATTAFQTIYPILARERGRRIEHTGEEKEKKRPPPLLNTCHAFASDSDIVHKHWPHYYTGDRTAEKRADTEAA